MLVAAASSPYPRARLGVTVSRRVGNAVVRNRIKRRIREWFRRQSQQTTGAHDILVIARPAAARLRGAATFAELSRLYRSVSS